MPCTTSTNLKAGMANTHAIARLKCWGRRIQNVIAYFLQEEENRLFQQSSTNLSNGSHVNLEI